jgi:hypothetical protein
MEARKLTFEFLNYLTDIQKLVIETAPGFDKAVSESSNGYLDGVSVCRFCPGCVLKNECYLMVKVDKLADSIFIKGRCLNT